MRNFKKIFTLIFVLLLTVVLVGCTDKQAEADKALLEETADTLHIGITDGVKADLKLPKYVVGDKEFAITWESSDTNVIEIKEYETEDKELYILGSVTMADEVKRLTLTATITYKEYSTKRTFEVKVLAETGFIKFDTIAEAKATTDKQKDTTQVKFNGTVSFATESGFFVTDKTATIYCYGSNHGRTIGEQVEVKGTWTYYNNMPQTKESAVKVLGIDSEFKAEDYATAMTIGDIAALDGPTIDAENTTRFVTLQFTVKENAEGARNQYKIVDPADATKTIDVSKYNSTASLAEVTTLFESGKAYEGLFLIYCKVSGIWEVLYVPQTAKEIVVELTDEQKVANVVAELTNEFNGINVKEDMVLPTSHDNGATISWASDNEEIISAAGVYVAPKAKTEVTLTATIKLNDVEETVEIKVTAKAKGETVAVVVTELQAGVAYKLGIEQTAVGSTIFANGIMSGFYGATVTDHTVAIDVFLEEVEGGYNLYGIVKGDKKYINAVLSDTGYTNYVYEDAASSVWVYNAEHNTITTTLGDKQVFIGTRGTYTTIGAYNISQLAEAYPVHFYAEQEKLPYATAAATDVAYKLGVYQGNNDVTLYATGALSGNFGATTESYTEGVDVFLEEVEGGYNLYFMDGETKKYIVVVESGTYKNYSVADAASTVWSFDPATYTLTTTFGENKFYMGTYKTYNTISVSDYSYVETSFPCRLYVADPDGESSGEVNPPVEVEFEYVTEVKTGVAYKLGVEQVNNSVTVFADGKLSGNFGSTTQVFVDAVDVYLEEVEGGYNLYFMDGETKKYIVVVVNGTYKNYSIADAASTVWSFDTEQNTLTTMIDGTKFYMGTYGTFNTISVSDYEKYVATSFPCRLYVEK